MKFIFKKGITILEVLVVIAIIGIITAIVLPEFSKMKQLQVLKNAGEDIISSCNKAKSQTLASLDSSEYGVHFESDEIIIFKGITFDPDDPDNEVIEIIPPAIISDISLTGGVDDFYFSRLTGAPNRTGSVTVSISSDPNLSKTITISPTGSASIN